MRLLRQWQLPLPGRRYYSSNRKSSNLDLSGIYPPIATPFNTEGQLDFGSLKKNFQHWNKIPFAGMVVMGSNGEAVSLKSKEKLELLREARKMANATSKIIAGLGSSTAEETVEMCNAAAEEGSADAALIITPSFYKGQMTGVALRKYYEDVAEKSKIPIILYSVPANTGIDLTPDVAVALSKHPNCIGMKDSGGDITKISQIVNETEPEFQVLAGSAGFLLPSLLMGCLGGVCALANVLGNEVCQLYELFREGRIPEAVALQRKLIVPNTMVTRSLGVPGLKTAMDATGLYGGPLRSPLQELEPKLKELLLTRFAEHGFPLQTKK